MTSTTKIRKRLQVRRRYVDHYPAFGTSCGRRGLLRASDDRRTLRKRKARRRQRLVHVALSRSFRKTTQSLREFAESMRFAARAFAAMTTTSGDPS